MKRQWLLGLLLLSCVLGGGLLSTFSKANIPDLDARLSSVEKQIKQAIDEQVKKTADANNAFGINLFKELSKTEKDKNIFISPYSIAAALSMTYNGAKENTFKEMEKTLGYEGIKNAEVNSAFQAMSARLNGFGKAIEVSTANSLWIKKDFDVLPEFIKQNKKSFNAEIQTREFNDATKTEINDWIAKQTKDKIKDVIQEMKKDNVMFLVNAIYFKGNWHSKFSKELTQDQDFWITKDQAVKTPLMHQLSHFSYMETKDFQALALPYATGEKGKSELAMYIFLPKQKDGLSNFLKTLDAKKWESWLKLFSEKEVQVAMPRFKIEYAAALNDQLQSLGIKDAFEPSKGNFDGIHVRTSGEQMWISNVLHKAFVDVNEEGTEAAAATVVVMSNEKEVSPPPISFTADHPFFFVIRDQITGSILFMGVLNNPK